MKFLFVVKTKKMATLGPMYLSAIVKKLGHESKIVEFDDCLKEIFLYHPTHIGYSILTGNQRDFKRLNASIKIYDDKIITIAGGPHPTFFPDDENLSNIDYIVRGEGERFMSRLCGGNEEGYRDINNIPWPDRTDFTKTRIQDFIASRGCFNFCRYCYNDKWNKLHPEFDKPVRYRDPVDICNEISNVFPEFVYFQDSCFAIDMDWFKEFARIYSMDLAIPYHCHMRPGQLLNEERVALLRSTNCSSLRMALESASPKLRALMGRPKLDTNNVLKASRVLRKFDINFMIQNILAVPTSTIEDDLDTLEFNIKCKPDYAWSSIFVPYPGTDLGDQCKAEGWYRGDYNDIQDSFFNKSVLNFDETYKEQSYVLQKVFALCVEAEYLPSPQELTVSNLPLFVHNITRKMGDNRLYGE